MSFGSFINAHPGFAEPNATITVKFHLTHDIGYIPTLSDEVRLVTSTGVLVSRAPLDSARFDVDGQYTSGELEITCPAIPAGYILALYDCASMKRILSSPFRVLGQQISIPVKLDISFFRSEPATFDNSLGAKVVDSGVPVLAPFQPITVSFLWSDVEVAARGFPTPRVVILILCESTAPDNNGFLGNQSGYAHVTRVTYVFRKGVNQQSITLVAPELAGPYYEVRLLAQPASVMHTTVMKSTQFIISQKIPRAFPAESPSNVTVSTTACIVGECVEIGVRLRGREAKTEMMTELDHIRFFPVGRSEQDVYDGQLARCVGTLAVDNCIQLRAPLAEGCYDVAVRRFLDNETSVLCSQTLKVNLPDGHLEVLPKLQKSEAGTNGAARIIRCHTTKPGLICSEDRILVYDETANVVSWGFVHTESACTGTVELTLHSGGKYNVKYFSAKLCQLLPWRPQQLMSVSMTEAIKTILPTANLLALHTIHHGAPKMCVLFEKVNPHMDWREEDVQYRDVVALFKAGSKEGVATNWADDPNAMPAHDVVYLRHKVEADIQLNIEALPPGNYVIRYMVAIPHHQFLRVCTSECEITIIEGKADSNVQIVPVAAIEQASATELSVTVHRHYSSNSGVESLTVSPLLSKETRKQSVAQGAKITRRAKGENQSLLGVRRSSLAYGGVRSEPTRFDQKINETNFRGAILGPKLAGTDEQIVVTIHITEGTPRRDDLVILMNEDCTRVISELPVSLAMQPIGALKPSLDTGFLGTFLLNPPVHPGKVVAGYFSQLHRAVVLLSERIRVKLTETNIIAQNELFTSGPASLAPTPIKTVASKMPKTPHSPLSHAASKLCQSSFFRTSTASQIRAVLIGCSYMQQVFELGGPVNDVEAMSKFLYEHGNLEFHSVMTMHEETTNKELIPTAANIRKALRWLVMLAKPGDHLLFYFAGCGSRNVPLGKRNDPNARSDCLLLPTDFDFLHRNISYSELRQTLTENLPADVTVTVIIDACFTSTALDLCDQKLDMRSFSQPPVGVSMLTSGREVYDVAARSRWRCIAPPTPAAFFPFSPEVESTDKTTLWHGFSDSLAPVEFSRHSHDEKRSSVPLTLFEATRESADIPHGAWDLFVREKGRTMGLFTFALTQALEAEVEKWGRISIHLRWGELFETVSRFIRKRGGGQFQLPKLSVTDPNALDQPVFPLAGDE